MKKIIWTVATLVVLALAYFGYGVINERYFTEKIDAIQTKAENGVTSNEQIEQPAEDDNKFPEGIQEDVATEDSQISQENASSFLDVTRQDCDSSCKGFDDPEDLKYCQEVCGLRTAKIPTSGCEAIQDDLEKYYCFKDLAVSKSDPKICNNIEDSNIKKTCQNRILEDFLEQQQLN